MKVIIDIEVVWSLHRVLQLMAARHTFDEYGYEDVIGTNGLLNYVVHDRWKRDAKELDDALRTNGMAERADLNKREADELYNDLAEEEEDEIGEDEIMKEDE